MGASKRTLPHTAEASNSGPGGKRHASADSARTRTSVAHELSSSLAHELSSSQETTTDTLPTKLERTYNYDRIRV